MGIYDMINEVTIEARLSKEPELRYTNKSNKAVCRLSIANDKPYKKDVEQDPNWLDVIVWERLAEDCDRDLKKGSRVFVHGRLETRFYNDKDTGKKVKVVEIVADKVKYVRPSRSVQNQMYGDQAAQAPNAPATATQQMAMDEVDSFSVQEDDIPF